MQIARWASCTACRVASEAPISASTAAFALSPACSSSITESRAAASVAELALDLSAFLSNSRTTATSTTDAPGSASAVRRASAVLTLTSSSLLITSIMGILLGSNRATRVTGGALRRYQENHVGVRKRASAPHDVGAVGGPGRVDVVAGDQGRARSGLWRLSGHQQHVDARRGHAEARGERGEERRRHRAARPRGDLLDHPLRGD